MIILTDNEYSIVMWVTLDFSRYIKIAITYTSCMLLRSKINIYDNSRDDALVHLSGHIYLVFNTDIYMLNTRLHAKQKQAKQHVYC